MNIEHTTIKVKHIVDGDKFCNRNPIKVTDVIDMGEILWFFICDKVSHKIIK